MPQPHKGYRQRVTARLPYPLAVRAAEAAKLRRWSMSEYVSWCVEVATKAGPPRNTLPPAPREHSGVPG